MEKCGYHFNPQVTKVFKGPVTIVMDITCKKCPFEDIIEVVDTTEANARSLAIKEGMKLIRTYCPEFNRKPV